MRPEPAVVHHTKRDDRPVGERRGRAASKHGPQRRNRHSGDECGLCPRFTSPGREDLKSREAHPDEGSQGCYPHGAEVFGGGNRHHRGDCNDKWPAADDSKQDRHREGDCGGQQASPEHSLSSLSRSGALR